MSTFQRPVNEFSTTLATAHVAADGQLVMASGAGTLIGALGSGEVYRVTVVNLLVTPNVTIGIFQATGLSTDTLTGVTAVEGYSDTGIAAGNLIQIRATAKTFSDIHTAVNAIENVFNPATTTPAQIVANRNDYDPGSGHFQRWDADAARDVTGMVAGTAGAVRLVTNISANTITIKHEDAASSAANRFLSVTGADLALAQNDIILAVYDGTTARWRVTLFA